MIYQQASLSTNEEVDLNIYGNADSKAVLGPRDDALVTAEARDEAGDKLLITVRA